MFMWEKKVVEGDCCSTSGQTWSHTAIEYVYLSETTRANCFPRAFSALKWFSHLIGDMYIGDLPTTASLASSMYCKSHHNKSRVIPHLFKSLIGAFIIGNAINPDIPSVEQGWHGIPCGLRLPRQTVMNADILGDTISCVSSAAAQILHNNRRRNAGW